MLRVSVNKHTQLQNKLSNDFFGRPFIFSIKVLVNSLSLHISVTLFLRFYSNSSICIVLYFGIVETPIEEMARYFVLLNK